MQLRTGRDAWSKRLKKLDPSASQLPSARLNQRVGALSLIRVIEKQFLAQPIAA
jgi:hypothetical protein